MSTPLEQKSTVAEIRERFDRDVERFSNLETGQSATMDAPLAMELITQAAIASTHPIQKVLDLGCGAGNNTIKLRLALGTDFDAARERPKSATVFNLGYDEAMAEKYPWVAAMSAGGIRVGADGRRWRPHTPHANADAVGADLGYAGKRDKAA